jgi:tetratricopeptide (TPR) repeat protein
LSGQSVERWTAEEIFTLFDYLGCSVEGFAQRIGADEATVRRWRRSGKGPSHAVLHKALDDLLVEAVRKVAPWLPAHKVKRMKRRDLLRLLTTGALLPIGEMDFLPLNGAPPRIGPSTLDSLEATITALASTYNTSSSRLLLPAAVAQLDEACGLLLHGSMSPDQRAGLQAIVGDIATFAGFLSCNCGQLGRARAYLSLAEEQAQAAGDMALLAQALGGQSLLYAPMLTGGRSGNAKEAVTLLERAVKLADRYAPQIVRASLYALLAEQQTAAGNAAKADEALGLAARALQAAQAEGPVGSGFCSSTGRYAMWNEDRLHSFRGTAEMLVGRPQAASTLTHVLKKITSPRWRATALTDLGAARVQKHPEEAARHLGEAHSLSVDLTYTTGVQRILGVRERFDPKHANLAAVRELDERLGLR